MSDPLDRLKPALAERYRVDRELGHGGMASVYLAEDLKHHRSVALKVLRPELSAILGAERFLKEIEVTANLHHPNILPLYDSGQADSFLYYVMPYVEGETLRNRLTRERQLGVEETVEIAKAVAAGLSYAHSRGVIHRDIKPENILLESGQAVVADFGIALAVSTAGGPRLTETGLSLGTPQYMSPEQATGDHPVDARSDLYSLGAVVYEMLTGDPPHTGSTVQAIIAKVVSETPVPIGRTRELVPANVDAAVQRALARTPADRFASADQFADALTNPSFTVPAVAVQEAREPGLEGWRYSTHRSLANWQVVVGLAAALGSGVAIGAFLRGGSGQVTDALGWFEVDARPGTAALGNSLDISADGQRMVYIGTQDDGGTVLYRRDLGDPVAVPIRGSGGGDLGFPFLSPAGDLVGFYQDRQLKVVPVHGGAPRRVAATSGSARGGSWTGDGRIVYNADLGSGLRVVDAEGGDPVVLTVPDTAEGEVDHRWPHVLPGDRWVAFTIWRGSTTSAEIGLASLQTGEVRALLPGTSPRYAEPGYLVYASLEGVLRAARLDPGSGELQGVPMIVLDSIPIRSDGSVDYTLSRNGTLAFHSLFRQLTPVMVDRSGAERVAATPPLNPTPSPRFAPNGRAFAIGAQPGLWVYDLRLSTFTPLTGGPGFYPLWTPDSRTIIYSRNEGRNVHVYVAPADRAAEPEALVDQPGQYRTQDLSPDGRYLLLRRNVGARYELWMLDRDSGEAPERWLSTEYLERAPTFSPDGRWIALSSDESGRDEIYVRPFPGPGGRTQVSTQGGIEPAWHPNGRELFFRSGRTLLSTPVETGETFRVLGPASTLLEGPYFTYGWQRQYDVHPDGNRFLFFRAEDVLSRLNVVINWVSSWRDRLETS